jgi:hypothetical protein
LFIIKFEGIEKKMEHFQKEDLKVAGNYKIHPNFEKILNKNK